MAKIQEGERWGEGVAITPPRLHELSFMYDESEMPEGPFNVEYVLGLNRFDRLQLGVQFGVAIADVPGLTARAVYRMIFTLAPESPEAADPEGAFSSIITRMAPVAMYPFVREALASAAQKALMPNLVLPVTNVGLLWEPGEVTVPDPPSDG